MDIKKDFPIFELAGSNLCYLDSAATSQKPKDVINTISQYYSLYNAPVHRSQYRIANRATEKYEAVRVKVQQFINAPKKEEIIFTKNTNEALNLVTRYFEERLEQDDIIILSAMEHHANVLPWRILAQKTGAKVYSLPLTYDYRLDYQDLFIQPFTREKVKVVALTHASNVLGTINPIEQIIQQYKLLGYINAKFVIDGAQAIPHEVVDVQALNCDFYAFSAHKMLGPTGVGVLWGREAILNYTPPLLYGSHMIKDITDDEATFMEMPDRYEAGTPNIEGVIGLGAALDYLIAYRKKEQGFEETHLYYSALMQLQAIEGLTLYGPPTVANRTGIFSFNLKGIHAHDVAEMLGRQNVYVRAGHHCAIPLMQYLEIQACVRASFYIYNTEDDITKLIHAIKDAQAFFKV